MHVTQQKEKHRDGLREAKLGEGLLKEELEEGKDYEKELWEAFEELEAMKQKLRGCATVQALDAQGKADDSIRKQYNGLMTIYS